MRQLFLLFAFLFILPSHSQDSDTGAWYNYFGNNSFAKRFNWHNEVQWRNFNFGGDLEQLLLRTGVGYNLTEGNNNVLLGYAYVRSEPYVGPDDKGLTEEHRLFQQYITKQNFGRVFLQHRYRFEERWVEKDFRTRFRYMLLLNVPLNKKTLSKNAVYLAAYDEIFLNGSGVHYDRNRIYGGIGYALTDFIRLEAGWMKQQMQYTHRAQIMLSLYNNLPF